MVMSCGLEPIHELFFGLYFMGLATVGSVFGWKLWTRKQERKAKLQLVR
jgi:hypothetical protein